MNLHNDKYVEYMMSKLPNFYRDYVYDDKYIRVLFDSLVDSADLVREYVDSVKNNYVLTNTEIVSTDAIKAITLSTALYDVTKLPISWDNLSLGGKVDLLDELGYYELLDTDDLLGNHETIVDMEILRDFSGYLPPYRRGEDYVIVDNKLYLFGTLAKPGVYGATRRTILVKSHVANKSRLWRRWGIFIPEIDPGPLGGTEYRDLLATLVGFEPTATNMRRAIIALSGAELGGTAMFMDHYSRKNVTLSAFHTAEQLGRFEFTYKLPPEYAVLLGFGDNIPPEYRETQIRLQNIISFMKLMKPAHTNFFLGTSATIVDSVVPRDTPTVKVKGMNSIVESVVPADIITRKAKSTFTDTLNLTFDSVYDSEAYYDVSVYDGKARSLDNLAEAVALSPDGSLLVVAGRFTGRAKTYLMTGQYPNFISDIYADTGTTPLSSHVYTATFSPDGSLLVLGGLFAGYAKLYYVSNNRLTFISNIYSEITGTVPLDGSVITASFSPNGSLLILGGWFTGYAKVYSVLGTSITFVSNISLSGYVGASAFSPDGSLLVLGGAFTNYCRIYQVVGTTVTSKDTPRASASMPPVYLNDTVSDVAFSPNGATLVIGGSFTGRAKVYSISGTTSTYVRNIYADGGTTALDGAPEAIVFSPNGAALLLVGSFSGHAAVYAVSGTVVTFVRNLSMSSIGWDACINANGSLAIIVGGFPPTGYAKLYAVSGTTYSLVSEVWDHDDAPLIQDAVADSVTLRVY